MVKLVWGEMEKNGINTRNYNIHYIFDAVKKQCDWMETNLSFKKKFIYS